METPTSADLQVAFPGRRTAPAILASFRETRVGKMAMPPLQEGEGEEVEKMGLSAEDWGGGAGTESENEEGGP